MQSVNVYTDEIALVVESVGGPHLVVVDVRIIPDVYDVVVALSLYGNQSAEFPEVPAAAGHVFVDIRQHLVDMRYFL